MTLEEAVLVSLNEPCHLLSQNWENSQGPQPTMFLPILSFSFCYLQDPIPNTNLLYQSESSGYKQKRSSS